LPGLHSLLCDGSKKGKKWFGFLGTTIKFCERMSKMEVILTSVFSAIIILITVFSMIRVFNIAYKRNELSRRKFVVYSTFSIIIGVIVASIFPFGYERIMNAIV
jgi:uncharacterized membrane protein